MRGFTQTLALLVVFAAAGACSPRLRVKNHNYKPSQTNSIFFNIRSFLTYSSSKNCLVGYDFSKGAYIIGLQRRYEALRQQRANEELETAAAEAAAAAEDTPFEAAASPADVEEWADMAAAGQRQLRERPARAFPLDREVREDASLKMSPQEALKGMLIPMVT